MKLRILSYRMPPCRRRPVTARNCSAALQHFQTSTECCLEFGCRLSNVSNDPDEGGEGGDAHGPPSYSVRPF